MNTTESTSTKFPKNSLWADINSALECACDAQDNGDLQQTFNYVKYASDLGDAYSEYILGLFYRTGTGVDSNRQESLNLFIRAAEKGCEQAYYSISSILTEMALEEYLEQNYDEALRLFIEAAYIGNSTALYMVGLCDASHHGKLAEKDNDLENIIIKGRRFWNITQRGIKAYRERNYEVAIPLLMESSEEGNCFAQLYLAQCYLHGYGVKEDKEQAYKLAVASAAQGWKCSQDFLKTYF